ncbi:MAG TPA: MBOAT family O-acyltransferase [Cyclobacteriaceae bacterium]|nr:MBOAT family O-acyltransferase [Cyclobacteriaceae bacterium]
MRNFAFPYFSRDIAEFWRRWHISLSTWFRDYVYIPLGGSKGTTGVKIRNTFIVFILSGLWHGANWTFVMWGLLNAIYFLPLLLTNKNRDNLDIIGQHHAPRVRELVSMIFTFALTVFAWIFFRSESLTHAFNYIGSMFYGLSMRASYIQTIIFIVGTIGYGFPLILFSFIMIEWLGRKNEYAIASLGSIVKARVLRYGLYYSIVIIIFWFIQEEQQFIYFQF